ncbi:hypothetical protein IWQ60_009444 [Tieghemiomyces parasiticus]|uniref:Uncharacterized protein n=1 Tax=Tieghemiomyces parasiticus TaxID=78921 RepID=A0A9W7ZUN6_9FUNG|nr:hypothetical protein IWQ60_009444 [Tieghemiomyces parasiticus]
MRALRDYLAVPVPRYQLRTVLGLALLFTKDGQMARPVSSGEAIVHLATVLFRHLTGFIVDLTEDERPWRAPIVDHGLLATTLFVLSTMMSEIHPKGTDRSSTSSMDVDPPYPVYLHGWVQIGEILRDVGWSPLAPQPATLSVSSAPVEEVGGEQAIDLERPEHAPRAIRLLWSQGLAQLLQVLPRPFLTSHLNFLETWRVRSEPIFKGDDTEWPFRFLASRLWRLSTDESTASA